MSQFYISKANPLRFILFTETGGINEGETFEENSFYNLAPICGNEHPLYFHKWCCSDEIRFQFKFEDTGEDPIVRVHRHSDGAVLYELPCTLTDPANFIYDCEFIGDENSICEECIYFTIASTARTEQEAANIFADGDSGTMEANINGILTNGANTIAQTNSQAQAGINSAIVTAGATPTGDIHKIMQSFQTQNYTAGRLYKLKAWVYLESAQNYLVDGDIGIRVGHIPGITVISSTEFIDGVSPLDTWFELETVFKTSIDTVGNFRIEADDKASVDNQNQPSIYIDSITVECLDYIEEAQTETIELLPCDSGCLDCTELIEYESGTQSFGLQYGNNQVFKLRMPLIVDLREFNSKRKIFTYSDGTIENVYTEIEKSAKFKTGWMPDYMHEIVTLAFNHDTVRVDGVAYVIRSDYKIDDVDKYSLRKGSGIFIYQNYINNKNSNC